ncbi:RING finger protein nhl-1-like [Liolophura sinensis]|uniref:RING finger protein nhl-1-like n=1 Tax=Liolophura sinensis TaxID=3198878 RepID=UPI00315857C2
MVTAASIMTDPAELTYSAEQIQRLLRCPVCLDRYQEPRLLPCQHTFCLRPCLEGLADAGTRTLRCPECRAEHRLPMRGISALPKNLTVISFLELPSPTNGVSSSTPRDPGRTPRNEGTVEAHCAGCSQHGPLTLCPHCNDQICDTCSRSHASQLRQDIARLVGQIRRGLPKLSKMFSLTSQRSDQLKQNCEVVSTAIQDAIEGLIRELKSRQVMLKSELNTFLLGEQHSLRLIQETLEVEAATVASFCDLTESVLQCPQNEVPIGDLVPMQQQCTEHLQTIRTQSSAGDGLMAVRQPRFVCDTQEALNIISNLGELVVNTGSNPTSFGRGSLPSSSVRQTAFSETSSTPLQTRSSILSIRTDFSPHTRHVSRYLRRLPVEERNGLQAAQADQGGELNRRNPRDRNNSERMAGLITGDPNPSRSRRTWNVNNRIRPLEMVASERSNSRAESTPEQSSETNSDAPTQPSGNIDEPRSRQTDIPRVIRRPIPAPVRFDIDINENLEDLADDLENTMTFRYSTGDSSLVSTPRNNYQQKGRSILRFGERGNGQNQFTWPRGVAVHTVTNDILVADSSNHRIQVFDDCGRFVRTIGSYGQREGEIDCLAGITVNSAGDIIIADRYNQRVQVFDSNGQFKSTFGAEGSEDSELNYPWGVACDQQGNIYVCDKENHRVQVFRADGTFLRKFGQLGSRPGQFENPSYIAVNHNGKVYVTDSNNHRVQVFDENGAYLFMFGVQGTQRGQVKYPKGIAIDEQGFVLVADSGNNRVQVFRQDGRFYCMFGSWGSENGQFKGLEGVAIMPNGNVVVSDRENHRIQVF